MFEPKDIIGDAVHEVTQIFRRHKRGDVVPWEVIETAAGFDRRHPHWISLQKRFRRDFMAETGILVWPVNGQGLELVSKDDQLVKCSVARERRAHRQLTRTIKALKALPDRELTLHQRQVKHQKIEQARKARRGVSQAVRTTAILSRPSSNGIPFAGRKAAVV